MILIEINNIALHDCNEDPKPPPNAGACEAAPPNPDAPNENVGFAVAGAPKFDNPVPNPEKPDVAETKLISIKIKYIYNIRNISQ